MPDPLVTLKEAVERLGVSPQTIRRMVREGIVKGYSHGMEWFIPEADIEMFVGSGGRYEGCHAATADTKGLLWERQHGRCPCCGSDLAAVHWSVEYTRPEDGGQPVALLCDPCQLVVAFAGRNPEVMRDALVGVVAGQLQPTAGQVQPA